MDIVRQWLHKAKLKKKKFIHVPFGERISLFTSLVQGLCLTSLLVCSVSLSFNEHTHTHTHTHTHIYICMHTSTLSCSPSPPIFPFLISLLPMELWLKSAALSHLHTGLRVTHCCIPEWCVCVCVLLILCCGSVLGVYTGGKGVNATCFKEVQDVFTSALTGTLGKSWN